MPHESPVGKIFVTGDCHRTFSKFNTKKFPEQKLLSKDDVMLVCGDFGGIWTAAEDKEERYLLNLLESRSFTTAFVDGNHENFSRLDSFPVSVWNGGNVHFIRPSIIHLMRGQIYTIHGKTFFTFGGAKSHDMSGGLLDPDDPALKLKIRRLNRLELNYRLRNVTWWERELPSEEEMEEGIRNLERQNWSVDYVITHCAPTSLLPKGESDILTDYFDMILNRLSFKTWYFGHYHDDRRVSENAVLLLDSIMQIC